MNCTLRKWASYIILFKFSLGSCTLLFTLCNFTNSTYQLRYVRKFVVDVVFIFLPQFLGLAFRLAADPLLLVALDHDLFHVLVVPATN